MKIRTISIISLLILVPNFLYAAGPLGSLVDLANTLAGGVVTSLGYLMFTLAVVAFLWGMVNFIWAARNGDSGKGFENGKQFMMWGLVSLFVMFSVWGIIKFAQNVFSIQNETSIIIPNIQLLGAPVASSPAPSGGTPAGKSGEGVACASSDSCATGLTCVGNNISNKVCTDTSKVKDASCIVTVCTNANNPSSCLDKPGKYDAQLECVEVSTSASNADPFCLAYGKDAECTLKDASGRIGHCNASKQCIPDSVTTTSNVGAQTTGSPAVGVACLVANAECTFFDSNGVAKIGSCNSSLKCGPYINVTP